MATVLNNKDRNLVKKRRNCFFLLVSIFCAELRQFSNSIFFRIRYHIKLLQQKSSICQVILHAFSTKPFNW